MIYGPWGLPMSFHGEHYCTKAALTWEFFVPSFHVAIEPRYSRLGYYNCTQKGFLVNFHGLFMIIDGRPI